VRFPITVGLRRSRLIGGVLPVLTAIGLIAIERVAWPPVASWLVAVALVLAAFAAARGLRPRIETLRIDEDGSLSGLAIGASEFSPVRLLPGATAHPWLTVMRLAHAQGIWLIVVAPDCVAPEDFRRLRVWLRWRASVSDGSDDS